MPGPPHEGDDRRDISKRRTAVKTGQISLDSLREIAGELERANWIGTLHVSAGDSEKYIYFSVGGLRLVSTGTRKYTSLGRVLVREGVVKQHDLAKALQAQSQSSARLGEILVRWKLATKEDLEGCVRVQVENELRDIVTWDDGEYRFSRGMPGDSFERTARATTISLDIAEFWSSLLETAERYKEIRAKIPNLGAVLKLTELGRAAAESPDTPVAVMEFLQAVDGKAGLQEVANRAEFGRFEVIDVAYQALRGGQVQLTGASRLAPRDSGEIKNLERALDQALNDVLIRRKLAEAYERAGETAKAVENYKQIAAEASRNYRDEEAIGALEKVSRLMPTEFGAQEQLLDAYQRTGKKAKVIEHGSRLGELYRANRLYNRAKQALLKVIGLAPRNVKIRTTLGNIYEELGDAPAAVREWETAVKVLKEDKGDNKQLEKYSNKILDLDAGNRVARKVLSKIGERSRPFAGIARAAVLVVTAGAVGFVWWSEYTAAARYNAVAAAAEARLERGEYAPVLDDVMGLAHSRPVSLVRLSLDAHEADLTERWHDYLNRKLRVALIDAKRPEAEADPKPAIDELEARLSDVTGFVPAELRGAAQRRLAELRELRVRQREAVDSVARELSVQPPNFRDAFRRATEAGPGVLHPEQFAGLPPLPVPLRSDPPGARVMSLDGRLIGTTPAEPGDRAVTVPVPVAGRLRCRVHLAGYEPLDLDVPWAEVRWPHTISLQKEAAWGFQLAGPPSGGSVVSTVGGGGLLIGSVDRHLYRLGRHGNLRTRTPLGLRGEVVGEPLARPEAALVATLDGRLRGFDADGRQLVAVRLPAAPAGGPVMLGDDVAVALVSGECWLFPLAALLQTAGGADAAGVAGARAAKLEQAPVGPPVPFGREWFLLLGKEGRMAVFRARDGMERYRRELEGRPAGVPAVADDGVCFIALAGGRVEARVVLTGQSRWPQPARVTGGAGTGPVVAGDYLLVGSAKDGVYAFDRKSGVREGRYLTGAGVTARPAVADDVVYVGDLSGSVSAFGLKPGAGRRWARDLGAPIHADLRVAAGAVIAITEEGRVIALRE